MKDTDRGVEPSIQSRFTFAPIEEFAKILDSAPDPPGYYQARLDLAHLSLMSGFDELICLDQRERYAVKTAVRWLNALRVYLDVIVVVYEVQRKRRTRELLLVWNPLKKGFEDLSCEHCGVELRSFWMCDDVPHILCPQCNASPKCGKNICRACSPQKCPRCQQSYI